MASIQEELEELHSGELTVAGWNWIRGLEMQLDQLLSLKEYYWQQRASSDWLKAGDRNTKFFQRKAARMNKKNKILGLEDESGVLRSADDEIATIIEDYFGNIFTSANPSSEALIEFQIWWSPLLVQRWMIS